VLEKATQFEFEALALRATTSTCGTDLLQQRRSNFAARIPGANRLAAKVSQ
jgi:hypothetical protein